MRSVNKQFIEIQRLRGVAVLMVIFAHMEFIHEASGVSAYFWNSAAAGVDIFFVISGFVVGKNLFEHLILHPELAFLKQVEANVSRLKAFFVRRIFRLFPAIFLMLLPGIALDIYGGISPAHAIMQETKLLFAYISMQIDMEMARGATVTRHLWTLSVEERFYLIIPFVILACATPSRFMKVAMGIFISLTLIKNLLPVPENVLHYNGFLKFDSFMTGMLVYLIYRDSDVFKRCFETTHPKTGKIAVNFITLLILAIAAQLAITGAAYEVSFLSNGYYYFCINILAAVLIVFAIRIKAMSSSCLG